MAVGKSVRNIILASAGLIILGCIAVVIYLGLRAAAPFIGSGSYKAEIERIHARHEPVSAADLAGPGIPDSQNGAVLYASAFQGIKRADMRRTSDEIGEFLGPRRRNQDPKHWNKAEKLVAEYEKPLKVVEAAAMRPKCRFPVDWTKGFDIVFDHLDTFQFAHRLLYARALLQSRNGQMDGAVHTAEIAVRMQNSLRDEPALINYAGRMQAIRRACNISVDIMRYGNLSESQAKRLYNDLESINLDGTLSEALKGERAVSIIIFDRLRTRADRMVNHEVEKQGIPGQSFVGRGIVNGWLGPDELYYFKLVDEWIKMADLPHREIASKLPRNGLRSDRPWYVHVADILHHDPQRTSASRDSAIADVAASQIILALHVYRNEHGSYPASLSDLRKVVDWKLDADPFSGKDFIYKRKLNGFLLYSVGPDLHDDGGKDPRHGGHMGPGWGGPRDIAWVFDY